MTSNRNQSISDTPDRNQSISDPQHKNQSVSDTPHKNQSAPGIPGPSTLQWSKEIEYQSTPDDRHESRMKKSRPHRRATVSVMSSPKHGPKQRQSSPNLSKSRTEKFHKLFKSVPLEEFPIDYFSCAYQGDILLQGFMYVSPNWVCFYTKIKARRRRIEICLENVRNITREKTALIIPNAIGIHTQREKYVFGSLMSRDSTYKLLVNMWQRARDSSNSTEEINTSNLSKDCFKRLSAGDITGDHSNNNLVTLSPGDTQTRGQLSSNSADISVSESDVNICPECGMLESSETDKDSPIDESPPPVKCLVSKPHSGSPNHVERRLYIPYFMQYFDSHKVYAAFCHMSLKVLKIPMTNFVLLVCAILVMFLLLSSMGLAYKIRMLQAKLETQPTWSIAIQARPRENAYGDLHSLKTRVHSATVQQLHAVLQANIQLLSEINASLESLHSSRGTCTKETECT